MTRPPTAVHHPPRRVTLRMRLTLLYGGMFFLAGAALLAVAYGLVVGILDSVVFPVRVDGPVPLDLARQQAAQLVQQFKGQILHTLLQQSLIALLVVGVAAIGGGWVIAGRALAPLNRVTAAVRRLSESTLHQRIALEGPQDEIKELADTFDALLARLHRAFDTQRRFVANASHELRTPLAINRTLLEVALADPEASKDLEVLGRTLLATNARSERLIEGLLTLARSERELTTRVPVDLHDLVAAALDTVGDEAARAELKLRRELDPVRAYGDPVLLERLVLNLTQNAVRHNVPSGEVLVRTAAEGGSALLLVENTGQVVPAHEVDGLFEPFRRLESDRVGSDRGTGLGLSIVRSVAWAHGGTVAAAPRVGGGLTVTVRIPSG